MPASCVAPTFAWLERRCHSQDPTLRKNRLPWLFFRSVAWKRKKRKRRRRRPKAPGKARGDLRMILRGTLDPGNTSAKGSGSVKGGTKGTKWHTSLYTCTKHTPLQARADRASLFHERVLHIGGIVHHRRSTFAHAACCSSLSLRSLCHAPHRPGCTQGTG